MGGKLFKGKSRRHTTEELVVSAKNIKDQFLNFFTKIEPLRFIEDKTTHGDLDLICCVKDGMMQPLIEYVSSSFDEYEISEREISFLMDELHVDLIMVDDDKFESAYNYFSFGDLGNLLGMIARSKGHRLSEQGVFKEEFVAPSSPLKRTYITATWAESLAFLGFTLEAIEAQQRGFKTVVEMFDFIKSSALYHKDIFNIDKMNSTQRRRFKQRPNQKLFLEYL